MFRYSSLSDADTIFGECVGDHESRLSLPVAIAR